MPWAHAPPHRYEIGGTYIVTASTYKKAHHLSTPEHLDFFQKLLRERAEQFNIELLAWSIFSNHYHFVAHHQGDQLYDLRDMLRRVHGQSALRFNEMDKTPGRKMWHQFWDTLLTDEKSRMSRMAYVMHNPVHHGLVPVASSYPWCSESWFLGTKTQAEYTTIKSFPIDLVSVEDDYAPILPSRKRLTP
jgi:putative transposase